jgi:hypothetical protein
VKRTHVETIIFDRLRWTIDQSRMWLARRRFKHKHADTNLLTHRFRQRDPKDFDPESFRTIDFGEPSKGIKAVVGHLRERP